MKLKIFQFFGIIITLPIWYYLLYQILSKVNATELMWFLFWVYVPIGTIVSGIARLLDDK